MDSPWFRVSLHILQYDDYYNRCGGILKKIQTVSLLINHNFYIFFILERASLLDFSPLKLLSNSWFPNSRMDDGYQICQNWFVISLSVIFWQQLSLFSNGRCDVSLWSQTLRATIFEEVKFPNLRSPDTLVPTALLQICFFCNYYDLAQPLKYIATTYIAEMNCRGLTKTAIRDREGYGGEAKLD